MQINEEDKNDIYNSSNWLHTMMTKFYKGKNKLLLDRYFKVNNANGGFLNTIEIKQHKLIVYERRPLSIDLESGKISICFISLYGSRIDISG